MRKMLRPVHMAPGHEAIVWTEAVTRQGVDTSLQPSTAHARNVVEVPVKGGADI